MSHQNQTNGNRESSPEPMSTGSDDLEQIFSDYDPPEDNSILELPYLSSDTNTEISSLSDEPEADELPPAEDQPCDCGCTEMFETIINQSWTEMFKNSPEFVRVFKKMIQTLYLSQCEVKDSFKYLHQGMASEDAQMRKTYKQAYDVIVELGTKEAIDRMATPPPSII